MPRAASSAAHVFEDRELTRGVVVVGRILRGGEMGPHPFELELLASPRSARASRTASSGAAPTRCMPVSTFRWTGNGDAASDGAHRPWPRPGPLPRGTASGRTSSSRATSCELADGRFGEDQHGLGQLPRGTSTASLTSATPSQLAPPSTRGRRGARDPVAVPPTLDHRAQHCGPSPRRQQRTRCDGWRRGRPPPTRTGARQAGPRAP